MYTYFKSNSVSASRIDMWLISKSVEPHIQYSGTVNCCVSDHNGVVLNVSTCIVEKGPGRWQMNSDVLYSDIFKNNFEEMWNNWQNKKANYSDLREWWEEGKGKIKEFTIYCSVFLKKSKQNTIKELERELLECQNRMNINVEKVAALKQELQNLYQREVDGCKIRSKVLWAEEGETSSRFFHSLEKKKAVEKMWSAIKDKNGNLKFDIDEILLRQVEYYKELYTAQGIDEPSADILLNSMQSRLSEADCEDCEADITYADCEKVVKQCKSGKSPGLDGICGEFYKLYWQVIGQDFVEIVNCMWDKQELCDSQYVGLIRLLYKKGEREDITNWRPITLLNSDYKIIEKVLANRLKTVVPGIVCEDQKGFVKGRHMEENVRLVEDVMDYCETFDKPGAILCVDQSKAFDRVEWEWLDKALEVIGFGPRFRQWIKILYKNANSLIFTNGFMSRSFKITRGVRQGSPLGPYLYIIQSEVFAEYIRSNQNIMGVKLECKGKKEEIKLSTFADDTQAYVGDMVSVDLWFEALELFGKASGAKVNKNKTQGVLLGAMKRLRNRSQEIVWGNNIEVLGFSLSINRDRKEYWKLKLAKVGRLLKVWAMRNLTLRGKVYLIKCYGINVIQHCLAAITVPDEIITQLESMFWKFLWGDGRERAKRHVCMRKIEDGGLDMPNLRNLIKAHRLKFVCKILSQGSEKWKFLPRMYLMSYDEQYREEFYQLRCINDINMRRLPVYYRECVQAFHVLKENEVQPETKYEVLGQYLWGNKWIKLAGNSLHDASWCKVGIKQILDLFTSEGQVKEENVFDTVGNRDQNFIKLNRLVSAVPRHWKDILRTGVMGDVKDQNLLTLHLRTGVVNLEKCTLKQFCVLLSVENVKSDAELCWERVFGPIEWRDVYKIQQCKFISRKTRDFRWKVINKCLTTEAKLKHFTETDGSCKLCTLEQEDERHILSDCVSLENFWTHVITLLKFVLKVRLEVCDRVFICCTEQREIAVNVIIEEAKWQVWKRRCLIRYENVWITDVELMVRLRNSLLLRTEVIKRSKYNNEDLVNKLNLFANTIV